MKLKELFESCEFKDIAPYIAQYYGKEAASGMVDFKTAFDILRHTQPKTDMETPKGVITISLNQEKEKPLPENYPKEMANIKVSNCWGDDWKSELAMEVVVSDGLTISNSEIAAHCLWQLTFWGFDQSSEEGLQDLKHNLLRVEDTGSSNPYAVAAKKLERKLTDNYLPKKRKKEDEILGSPAKYGRDWKIRPRTCRNRLKRMRDNRQEKRIKKLKRMAKVENSIRCLTADTKSFHRKELEYLFNTNLILKRNYRSHTGNHLQRVAYLIDLLSNYETDDYSEFTHFLLMFRTAPEYPVTRPEKDMIEKFFSQYLPPTANIRFGYGTEEKLGMEASLILLGSY